MPSAFRPQCLRRLELPSNPSLAFHSSTFWIPPGMSIIVSHTQSRYTNQQTGSAIRRTNLAYFEGAGHKGSKPVFAKFLEIRVKDFQH